MGRRGGSQPFLWYICQLLHHIKLAEDGVRAMERVRERRWRTNLPLPSLSPSLPLTVPPPPLPHQSVVISPSPYPSAPPVSLCVQCHGEEIGKYIINKTDGPSPFPSPPTPSPSSLPPPSHCPYRLMVTNKGEGGGEVRFSHFPSSSPFLSLSPLPLLPPFRIPFYLWV